MKSINFKNKPTEITSLKDFDFDKNDRWPAETIGHQPDRVQSSYYLHFDHIRPAWLKKTLKKFVRLQATVRTFSSCKSYVIGLAHFAEFLCQYYSFPPEPNAVTRRLIIEYLNYLAMLDIRIATRRTAITHFRTFHQIVIQEKWLPWPNEPLIFSSDIPKEIETLPKYIPESVIDQLKEKLVNCPDYFQRLIVILLETGRRIGEICSLPFSCIEQDKDGDWFLRIIDKKIKRNYLIPISPECLASIQQQQIEVKNSCEELPYLFPARNKIKSQHITARNVNEALNKLAQRQKIKDSNGNIWHFHAHQFRHTVGTRMINAGVSQCIVQRYLGHESPEMTARYAHIHDETLKKAFLEYQQGAVDIHGNQSQLTEEYHDAKWLKNNIMAQALPNGLCTLPLAKQRCPHANACLTCGHFRTNKNYLPNHEEQLKQTEALIETAKCNGWQRQVEMNLAVKSNLERIIIQVKGGSND